MTLQARSADACLAVEFNSLAKGYSLAKTAQYLFRSYLLTFSPSIHNRRALFLMNCAVRIASSMA